MEDMTWNRYIELAQEYLDLHLTPTESLYLLYHPSYNLAAEIIITLIAEVTSEGERVHPALLKRVREKFLILD